MIKFIKKLFAKKEEIKPQELQMYTTEITRHDKLIGRIDTDFRFFSVYAIHDGKDILVYQGFRQITIDEAMKLVLDFDKSQKDELLKRLRYGISN